MRYNMGCFIPDKLYGVIGWPLAQSLSPLLHNTGFQALGIKSVYMAWPVKVSQLEDFIKSMPILAVFGCSVTIPHKMAVLPYLDSVSEAASLAGAANTLYWREGELCGENTDVEGFLAPLRSLALDKMDALLLGAGGAAHAVAAGLRLAGCPNVYVTSPGNQRQFSLAQRFGFTPLPWDERYRLAPKLIINATPLGMYGENENKTPYDFSRISGSGWAYDLVYNPLETMFLREAKAAGRKTISGLDMFFGQGNAQFRLWTGQNLPPAAKLALDQALGA